MSAALAAVCSDVAPLPFDVYPLRELKRRGWDRPAVDRAVRRGDARWLRRGVYALGPPPTQPADAHAQQTAAALCGIGPAALASHRSGAVLRGLPVLGSLDVVTLTVPRATHRVYEGLSVHVASITGADRDVCRGLPATSVGRTLVDLARVGGRAAGLVAADAALHAVLDDADARAQLMADWERALDQAWGWPGVVTAREVATLVDGRAESPLETLLRLLAHDARLPRLVPQVWVDVPGGRYRVDAAVENLRVAVECDGRIKYREETLLHVATVADRDWGDRQRDWALGEAGWVVVHVTWDDVVHRPEVVRRRILAAIARVGRMSA